MLILELFIFSSLIYVLVWPIYAAYLFTHPPRIRVAFRNPSYLGVTYEDVTLTSSDGVKLVGWYVASRNQAAVILLHGHSGNRLAMMYPAEVLIKAGYGVLMLDLRAHGSSGGRLFTRGQHVTDDVLAAVAFLSKRRDVNAAGIGIMGVSVGGLLALQAAARTVAIRAVVADGPSPATFDDMPKPRHIWDRWLNFPLQRYYMKAVGWFSRVPPLAANITVIPGIAPRPLLFITTTRGRQNRLVRHYYEAAQESKTLWEVPNAIPPANWSREPELYAHHIISFFNDTLVTMRSGEIRD